MAILDDDKTEVVFQGFTGSQGARPNRAGHRRRERAKPRALRPAIWAAGFSILAGCGGSVSGSLENPRTTDEKGRAVVSAQEAANAFHAACYAPGGTRNSAKAFARRSGYEVTLDKDGLFFASSPSRSIGVSFLSAGICSVTFDAGIPNANAGAQAAQFVMAKVGVTGIGGKKGGGQINLKTAKGTVIVGNNARVKAEGASISLYKR